MPSILAIARSYVAAGLSVIPIRADGSKAPACTSWIPYRSRRPEASQLVRWFGAADHGLAIIGGKVSGGLEILDLDTHDALAAWQDLVGGEDWGLLSRLPVVRTPGGGHVYYRCPESIRGNQKLAMAVVDGGVVTVAETRGEGGYCLAPGCPPACHPTGGTYEHVAGPPLTEVPTVSPEERQLILSAAASLHQVSTPTADWDAPTDPDRRRPGDDYTARTDWWQILDGWTRVRELGGLTYWRRPGKREGWSATTGVRSDCGRDLLYVFSSNAHPFEAERSYSRFAAYTVLHHGGDYRAAAAELGRRGYGERRTQGPRAARQAAEVPAEPETAWEPPVPLSELPPAMPFPVAVLPPALADYATQCAWATNSPLDFVAVPMLGLAAGCLGAARALGITRTHVQPATMFTVVVGLPGTGKSPALERVITPLEQAEHRYFERWKRLLIAWQEEDPEARGDRPAPRRLLVDDTTSEALMKTLHANQRGLVMVRDEIAALIAGMNQYKEGGKGNDRQVYLKVWAASTVRVDRKSNEGGLPLVIRRPALSIVGGVQPDVVESFLADNDEGRRVDDGFLDRFLFAYPADLAAIEEQFRDVSDGAAASWDNAVQWLLSLEQWRDDSGSLRPKVIGLTGCGRDAWVAFTRTHAAELNAPEFPDHLRGPWSKLRGYCGRLALTLYYLDRAARGPEGGPENVDGEVVSRAALLTAYFKAHYLRVAARMGSDPRIQAAGKVLNWLRRNQTLEAFSRRDAYRQLCCSFEVPESLDHPLNLLAHHGYLRTADQERHAGAGRKASQRFEVNPLWNRRTDNSVNSVNFALGESVLE